MEKEMQKDRRKKNEGAEGNENEKEIKRSIKKT